MGKYKITAIRRTDGRRVKTGYCPVCDVEFGFEPFCYKCGDVSGCEDKYYEQGITLPKSKYKIVLKYDSYDKIYHSILYDNFGITWIGTGKTRYEAIKECVKNYWQLRKVD